MKEKPSFTLDYAIGTLTIAILVLATFLLPQAVSAWMDNKAINQAHVLERESFTFRNPVQMAVKDRVQQTMEAIEKKGAIRRTFSLTGGEAIDEELLEGVREAMGIAARNNLVPDLSSYDIEHFTIYAEYFNLNENAEDGTEAAFWNLRFCDYETFDILLRVDAVDYVIYQMEYYSTEAAEYVSQITSDDLEVVEYYNNAFAESCRSYFELEGYDVLTAPTCQDMLIQAGFERGEYTLYRSVCQNSFLDSQGIRWGLVPMTIALEKGSDLREWGYGGIEGYFLEKYGLDAYTEIPE